MGDILYTTILFIAILIAGLNEYYQRRMGVSPMPTMPKVRRGLIAQIPAKTRGKIAELGAGWGGISFALAKKFPENTIIGFECSPVPLLISRIRKLFKPSAKNLEFRKQDFFEADFSDMDAIVCYLCNPLMAELEPKFKAELKPGTRIISSTFYMPNWKPKEIIELKGLWKTKIYVYEA